MKSNLKLFAIILVAFVLGMTINNIAYSTQPLPGYKLAVVDVSKVVDGSKSVSALKSRQKAKIKSLMSFVKTAKADVAKQKTAKGKKVLEDKYNKALNKKKAAIESDYAKRLAAINKNISKSIADVAKQKQYNVVLAKSTVLYGGDDITKDVMKIVK